MNLTAETCADPDSRHGNGKIAVLGANSRLGQRIVGALGQDAIAISRGQLIGNSLAHSIIVGDYAAISEDMLKGCRAVINCIGAVKGDAQMLRHVNVGLSVRACEIAKQAGISRFVHFSSFSVYGHATQIGKETPEHPVDPYGISKMEGDHALLAVAGVDVGILRIPAVLGAGVPSKLSQLWALWRKVYVLPVSRTAARSMISLDAAAGAAITLAKTIRPVRGIWLVADPKPVSLYEIGLDARVRAKSMRMLIAPAPVQIVLQRLLPFPFERIFGSSILNINSNNFPILGLAEGIEAEISRIIENDV